MKKIIMFFAVTLLITLGTTMTASATVGYNENTDRYYSTDENDGVFCFNGSVYTNEELVDEFITQNTPYFENIVPTNEDQAILLSGNASHSVKDNKMLTQLIDRKPIIFETTPKEKYFLFNLNKKSLSNIDTYSVEIIDMQTNVIIAKGYNLKANQLYKTSTELDNIPIQVKITTTSNLLRSTEFEFGGSNSKHAEISTDGSILNPNPRIVTGNVPVDIDGNQGKILAKHTIQANSHRYLKTIFEKGTNGMSSINMGYEIDGVNMGYALNVSAGSNFKCVVSFGSGFNIDVRLSTNKTSGKATLSFVETTF